MSAPENEPSVEPSADAATDPLPVAVPAPVADPASDVVPAPPAGPVAARRLPRAVGVALATAGLLAVTATSAAVTVAVGKPDDRHAAALAAPSAEASRSASASPTPTPTPTPTETPTLAAPPAPAPKPSSTLHGTVDGATHGGDLRYFLVPVPDGGEPYGVADGAKLTDEEVAADYKQDNIMSILASYGYKEAVDRTYRTADGKMQVEIRLMRFSSASHAASFAQNATFGDAASFGVDGVPDGRGFMFKPKQQAYTGSVVGVGSKGDVEFEVTVEVKGDPDKALLADVMRRQSDRLSSGG